LRQPATTRGKLAAGLSLLRNIKVVCSQGVLRRFDETLFINGVQFKIILYAFKLTSLNSFGSTNSFELSTYSKARLVRLILILTKEFIIGSHL